MQIDGDPSDWDQYPLLQWAPIDRWIQAGGGREWGIPSPEWNLPPNSPEDLSARFKAGWGMIGGRPVLYLLVEWIDDEFGFDLKTSRSCSCLSLSVAECGKHYGDPTTVASRKYIDEKPVIAMFYDLSRVFLGRLQDHRNVPFLTRSQQRPRNRVVPSTEFG
jgi:hypothetical protein